jgi:enoyl-CoA hydratase
VVSLGIWNLDLSASWVAFWSAAVTVVDIDIMHLIPIDNPARFDCLSVKAKRIVFSMLECQKPIIAKVSGNAIGFGCTLALYSDIVFANAAAKIGDPHVKIGLVAGDGGAAIWAQRIGYTKAKEFLLTGEEATKIGLINYALPLEKLSAQRRNLTLW